MARYVAGSPFLHRTAGTTSLPLALTHVRANALVQYGGAVYVYDSSEVLVDGAIFTECEADEVCLTAPLSPPPPALRLTRANALFRVVLCT